MRTIFRFGVLSLICGLAVSAAIPAYAQPFAYVSISTSNSISVIDTATDSVVTTVGVGSVPAGIAITPNGAFVYTANFNSNNVSVINTRTNSVTATVTVGTSPEGIAITPDGAFAYVANANSNNVSVIDTATNALVASVDVGGGPGFIAITPDGAFAYVTNRRGGSFSVISTTTNTVTTTLAIGSNPYGIAITPDGAFAYIADQTSNSVFVIHTATNSVVTTVGVGSVPAGIAITPNGAFAYVTNTISNSVSVIDIATNTVDTTISIGTSPRIRPNGVAITPDGSLAYVTNYDINNVSVIDTETNTVRTTVAVNGRPTGIAITPKPTATQVASYPLTSSFFDELGGPDLVPNGLGVLGADGYEVTGHGTGLSLSGVLDPSNYSIEMMFRLDEIADPADCNWAYGICSHKVLDFKDRTEDEGLYAISFDGDQTSGGLQFFPIITSSEGAFRFGTLHHLMVTRSGSTDEVAVYVDGAQLFSAADPGGYGVFSELSSIAHFLTDDLAFEDDPPIGFIDQIRIYDAPLSASAVADLVPDGDGDGEPDFRDNCLTTPNSNQNDTDNDGQGDACDDTDHDGYLDSVEVGPDPANPIDSDGDGTPDYRDTDSDNDGLSDLEENALGTDRTNPDTDSDGLVDGREQAYGTDPRNADTDGDGLSDGEEVFLIGTNPIVADTDGDGLSDGDEINNYGSYPWESDSDGDGIEDGQEVALGSDPTNADTDLDGSPDSSDNCISIPNTNQSDVDGDTIGDICDPDFLGPVATIFEDPFEPAESPLWKPFRGDWAASGGVYDTSSGFGGYSYLPFTLKDFAVEVDVNQLQDGGIWLRSAPNVNGQLGAFGVLLVTGGLGGGGEGLYWHIDDGAGLDPILNLNEYLGLNGEDVHLRIEVRGNVFSAFINGDQTPATVLELDPIHASMFAQGFVGLYDASSTQSFDNLRIETLAAEPLALGPVYFDDFDGGMAVEPGILATLDGVVALESVRDYAGIGNGGNVFGGDFLHNETVVVDAIGVTGDPTRLTLTGLPPHSGIDLNFLFAKIASWDGSEQGDGECETCAPDLLEIQVDGQVVFSESFGFHSPSFQPAPGSVVLADFLNLGFSDWDSAYDMDLVGQLSDLPHTADTLVIEWRAMGNGWQGGEDESWAIDNVEVTLTDRDSDFDTVRDAIDNCPTMPNEDQADVNGDGFGDLCVSPDVVIPPGTDIGDNPIVGSGTTIGNGTSIGDNAELGDDVIIAKDLEIGDDVTVGDGSEIAKGSVIGDEVTIGENVFIAKGVRIGDGVTIGDDSIIKVGAVIGDDAALGTGVTIGKNATIAAGSVVPDNTSVPNGGTFP